MARIRVMASAHVAASPTNYAKLSRNGAWKMPDNQLLGLGVWNDQILFHRAEVIEVK